ncbi:uncharacterized protein RCC_07938 [Ramularia collo-cygni]|uniref:DNA2/NAM7 helicase-like C-terminal domain-containing protein n=1 Tax=Ramularia collo-cygni TaxID=112498 RepID=A0A2D3VJ34_9PEZI|nr:uncharacterized protein RCC_07938 [Ramularia collo-cygni]CZT22069.1 uncharacterized protein RCC_07938 [Ramularia collo-cygni]
MISARPQIAPTAETVKVMRFLNTLFVRYPPTDANKRMVFVDVDSPDKKGEVTGSQENAGGRDAIMDYVHRLVHEQSISPTSIGIISMYADDLNTLKKAIKDARLDAIKVSTVDGFQGQERNIMLVHLVASQHFKFIGNANRLNVALTRAKDAMIVVGNLTAMSNFLANKMDSLERADQMAHRLIAGMIKHGNENRQRIVYRPR